MMIILAERSTPDGPGRDLVFATATCRVSEREVWVTSAECPLWNWTSLGGEGLTNGQVDGNGSGRAGLPQRQNSTATEAEFGCPFTEPPYGWSVDLARQLGGPWLITGYGQG
jgi:hypothetical protein